MEFEPVDGNESGPVRELRRSYHDRIAEVRTHSLDILRGAVAGTEAATKALLSGDPLGPLPEGIAATALQERAALVDSEVIALLALESPVARDLRVILAARDVTQLGLLCVGLCAALADRVGRVSASLTEGMRQSAGDVGTGTEDLLRAAEGAWATLDAELAAAVVPQAAEVRARQTGFMTALIALEGVPMEAALDLALVARAFERLADHAVEIAERVRFAVQGTPAPALEP